MKLKLAKLPIRVAPLWARKVFYSYNVSVMSPSRVATTQELMEALLLLESCLDPKWLKPWYRPAQQKMQSTSYLLRLSTPAAVGLHLFALDRAILYDKVLLLR